MESLKMSQSIQEGLMRRVKRALTSKENLMGTPLVSAIALSKIEEMYNK